MELTEIAASLGISLATVKRDLEKANLYVAHKIQRDVRLHQALSARLGEREGG